MLKDLFLTGIGNKLWIGLELELNQAPLCARILVAKSVGKGRKHSVLLGRVLEPFLSLSADLGWIGQQHLQAGILPSLLLNRQRLVINGNQAVNGSSVGLAHFVGF